jgi:hypothetical protein
MKRERKLVSLSEEFGLIERALGAVRLLALAYVDQKVGGQADVENAPQAMAAVTVLVCERLKLVTRVARGTLDPATIHADHNDVTGCVEDGGTDLTLATWTQAERKSR